MVLSPAGDIKKIVSPISTLVLNTFVGTQIKCFFYDLLLKIINGDPATVMIVFQPEFYGGKNENDKVYSVARERKVGRYVRIFPYGFKLDRTGRLCVKVEIYGNPYLREYCTCLSLLNTLCLSKICYSSPFLHFFIDIKHLLIMTSVPGELYWVGFDDGVMILVTTEIMIIIVYVTIKKEVI